MCRNVRRKVWGWVVPRRVISSINYFIYIDYLRRACCWH